MAIINEAHDATINAHASGNYIISEGDVFNGNLGVGDHEDGINLRPLTPGTTYTVSVTVDDLAGFTGLTLINHNDFHSITHHVSDGVPHAGVPEFVNGWVRNFVETSGVRVDTDTNTISFDFTPAAGFTSFAFQVQGSGVAEAYSVTFEETVLENIVDGTDGNDRLNGSGDLDIITGGEGDDHLEGFGGNDVLNGGAGKDKLTAGTGDDTLNGGDGNDLLNAGDGNDLLDGGARNDRLFGQDGNDTLNGGSGNDRIDGGADDDVLDGGAGKDVLTGGSGADVFVFGNGAHRDTITDFEDGVDLMDFSGDASVTSLADLTITQSGANVVIGHGGPDQITLLNMNATDIDATDFIF
ncbi:calcium-binding protein [uncultured Tateyamaria sp.]|uniref:calcium-binding protein n=1 Tax=uncultured Tateyamaria sp. TaxID=455651 RepID=UPI002634D597|nr:calcium-binding protein [uncultured Tateyamaria sp.]